MEDFLELDPETVLKQRKDYKYLLQDQKKLLEHIKSPNVLILCLFNGITHHSMLPSLLLFLDSHEPSKKVIGIELVSKFIENAEKRTDYGQLLFQSIFPCTTYLDHPAILVGALEVLPKVIDYTYRKNTLEHDQLLEELLHEGIMQSFVYCRSAETQQIFIRAMVDLVDLLHVLIFKYLEGLLSIACEILPIYNHCARMDCMKLLNKLYDVAYVRFEDYYPKVLIAIAEAWRFGSNDQLKEELRLFALRIKHEPAIQTDLQALVSFDPIYEQLVH
jgi:hypothetical protein